jgi:ATP-dependent RNA helicase RhlE
MKFSDLRLNEPILRAVSSEGYDVATPIQSQAIPHVLEGKDLMGCAQTGTGKTAAFALPILQRLHGHPITLMPRKVRCLVLAPTRELATQIYDSFRVYGKNLPLRHAVIFGGVNQHSQVQALRNGVDVLIATPGRLLDLMNQRFVDVRSIEVLVLDEADRMLDMGFIHDIRKIVAQIPAKRQTLMFSATMPTEIRQLASSLLHNPVSVQVTPPATTVELIEQSVYFVEKQHKPQLLAHLFDALPMSRAIVFTRTKHGADRVVRHLHKAGIRAEAIHGNKSQNARNRALENFRKAKTPILVATDIASRGIDIDDVSHVVNYDLTHEPETYVHRIGRTARAGASGAAVSFCDRDEVPNLKAIEKLIRRSIPVKKDHPQYVTPVNPQNHAHAQAQPRQEQSRHEQPRASHAPRHEQRRHEPRHEQRRQPQHSRQDSRPAHAPARPAHPHKAEQPQHSNAPRSKFPLHAPAAPAKSSGGWNRFKRRPQPGRRRAF